MSGSSVGLTVTGRKKNATDGSASSHASDASIPQLLINEHQSACLQSKIEFTEVHTLVYTHTLHTASHENKHDEHIGLML